MTEILLLWLKTPNKQNKIKDFPTLLPLTFIVQFGKFDFLADLFLSSHLLDLLVLTEVIMKSHKTQWWKNVKLLVFSFFRNLKLENDLK